MQYLNLLGVPCPLNFVRVKLKFEEMQTKEILRVYLDDGQPIDMVPRSLENDGYEVLEKKWFEIPVERRSNVEADNKTDDGLKKAPIQLASNTKEGSFDVGKEITNSCWQLDVRNL